MAKANHYLMNATAVYEHVPDSVSFSWTVLGQMQLHYASRWQAASASESAATNAH